MARPTPTVPGPGQESVWDYPRPPTVDPSSKPVEIRCGDTVIGRSTAAVRVLETSHPPTWYLPPGDFAAGSLRRSARTGTVCEYKGLATYWDVATPPGEWLPAVAWSYQDPTPGFRSMAGYLSCYPGRLTCTVDGEPVRPQAGGFYGGWITGDVVGPFKGEPGSWGW